MKKAITKFWIILILIIPPLFMIILGCSEKPKEDNIKIEQNEHKEIMTKIKTFDREVRFSDIEEFKTINDENHLKNFIIDHLKSKIFSNSNRKKMEKYLKLIFTDLSYLKDRYQSKIKVKMEYQVNDQIFASSIIQFIFSDEKIESSLVKIFENQYQPFITWIKKEEEKNDTFNENKVIENFKKSILKDYDKKIFDLIEFKLEMIDKENSSLDKNDVSLKEIKEKNANIRIKLRDETWMPIEDKVVKTKINFVNPDFFNNIFVYLAKLESEYTWDNFDDIENEDKIKEKIQSHFEENLLRDFNFKLKDILNVEYKIEKSKKIENTKELKERQVSLIVSLKKDLNLEFGIDKKVTFTYKLTNENLKLIKILEDLEKKVETFKFQISKVTLSDNIVKEQVKKDVSILLEKIQAKQYLDLISIDVKVLEKQKMSFSYVIEVMLEIKSVKSSKVISKVIVLTCDDCESEE